MSQKPKAPANIGTAIKRAIRHFPETNGASFAEIKKHLTTMHQMSGDMPDPLSIKQYLKNAVDKGDLLKLDNGNYKVKETARRRRSRSKGKRKSRSRSRRRKGSSGGKKRRRSRSGKGRKRSGSGKRRRRRRKAAAEAE